MGLTYLSPEEFFHEVRRWGVTSDSLIRVRMMEKGENIHCKFAIPRTSEELETVISKKRFEEFDFINLGAIAVPAVWNDEFSELKKISKQLEELNAENTTSDRDSYLWHR